MPVNGLLYGTTPADLRRLASQCQSTNEYIQGQIRNGMNIIAELMAQASGADFARLGQVFQEWGDASTKLNFVLGTIAQGLNSNANNYDTNLAQNLHNVSVAGSSLPPVRL